jgi:hypothetical protein
MVLVAAALFGLAFGALWEFASTPRHKVIPFLASLVIIGLVVVVLVVNYPEDWAAGIILTFATLVGGTLASGVTQEGHPLLAGMGYWARVEFALRYARALRAYAKPASDAGSDTDADTDAGAGASPEAR